ncbi:MAG: hypothetical protein GY803_14815 [Chloroflexi bacterium]|nr:hypothetical protein [Chloroflexota bacterium]
MIYVHGQSLLSNLAVYFGMTMYQKNKVEKKVGYYLPPNWCSQICRNSMNEVCIEGCAPNRKTTQFELKKDVNLSMLPPFPFREWQEDMNPAERKTVAGLYLSKIVDRLQGRENNVWTRSTRPDPDRYRNDRVSKAVKVESVSRIVKEGDTLHSNGQEGADTSERYAKVPGGKD